MKREEMNIGIEETAIMSLRDDRAHVPEGICVELLKNKEKTKKIIANEYTLIDIFKRHLVSDQWKMAYMFSTYKKRSKKDSSNYRGISVISIMSCLYNKILNSLIEKRYSNF